ncbi:TetR family transcriptional regulator [Mycobacterium sp. 852002-51152_SCH6134967]|uniref:TetR/AcrR family transcriptional regulator n=1 Tax=Mycobacterium sp. 852002-51152_SCH6134967 TaxID=1834096 RepID=UPI0008009BC0|nr:TetR/AcrR family transcriptional regulator [Mycobacterium sp. 852002-51152_SCH6134967]OBF93347.1 TetR family transcriptional regulator [Mycobacterium sp. 852002-51152_SCH6134967]
MQKTELGPRERILRAAADLLTREGRDAVTTRSVSAAAAVQPPTIYRHFGDMQQLIDDAASLGMVEYLTEKRSRRLTDDPIEDLRGGWDSHIDFGVRNPHVYAVLYADPRPNARPKAVVEGDAILRYLMQRIAEAGRLRVDVDRAAEMMHSACRGVAFTLISQLPEDRDPGLSHATREAILAAITTEGFDDPFGDTRIATRAIALKSLLESADTKTLSPTEAALLREWLDRLVRS